MAIHIGFDEEGMTSAARDMHDSRTTFLGVLEAYGYKPDDESDRLKAETKRLHKTRTV